MSDKRFQRRTRDQCVEGNDVYSCLRLVICITVFIQFPSGEQVNLSVFFFFKKLIISEIAFVLSLLTIFSSAPFAKTKEAVRVVYFQNCAAVLMM